MLLKYKSFTHFRILCTSHKDLSYFDIHMHFLRIHIIGPFLVRFLRHRRYNEHNRRSGGGIEGQRKKHLVKRSNSGTTRRRPQGAILCLPLYVVATMTDQVLTYLHMKLNGSRDGEAGNSPALNYASTTESVIFIVRNIAQYLQRLHRQQLSE